MYHVILDSSGNEQFTPANRHMDESLGQFVGRREASIFGKGHNESLWVTGNGFFIDLCGDYKVMFIL